MSSIAIGSPATLQASDRNGIDLSTRGMVITLGINLAAFVCIFAFFEVNRYYKQIFLKRLQRRFIAAGRVPKAPPPLILGWLVRIMQVTELEVLHMVGLDGYIYLRFHAICLKFCVFASLTGILILLPTYSTLDTASINWDKYTLMNVLACTDESDASPKYRLWLTAVFGYIYTVYFCQLLYAEYNNFSLQRLHYLAQVGVAWASAAWESSCCCLCPQRVSPHPPHTPVNTRTHAHTHTHPHTHTPTHTHLPLRRRTCQRATSRTQTRCRRSSTPSWWSAYPPTCARQKSSTSTLRCVVLARLEVLSLPL